MRLPLLPGTHGDAFFSEDGVYRHWLSRIWGTNAERYVLWIGLNPSTAEALCDDPTIRREIAFTNAWGYRRYFKANLFDYRATDPRTLLSPGLRVQSDENIPMIRKLARRADLVIVCWGAVHKSLAHYEFELLQQLTADHRELWCLGMTKEGHPKHPLYLAMKTKRQRFEWPPID